LCNASILRLKTVEIMTINCKPKTLVLGFGQHWDRVALYTILLGVFKLKIPRSKRNPFYPLLSKMLSHLYDRLSYIVDWKDAFCNSQNMEVDFCNISNLIEYKSYLKRIDQYDLIIIMQGIPNFSLFTRYKDIFRNRKGKLAYFVTGEYKKIKLKVDLANAVNADYICSQLPINTAKWLYEGCHSAQVISVPLALNPNRFFTNSNIKKTIDICFCGDLYHNTIGDLERTNIIQYFLENGEHYEINCDIQIGRMEKAEWLTMLQRSRGIVGAESGTYFLDRDDKISTSVQQFQSQFPDATFEEVFDVCFKKHASNCVSGKCVSSRHFEAVGTKTCQILIEGNYNGILKPDEHYIAVKKDLSNIDEAIDKFKNEKFRESMIERTYRYVMENHTYSCRVSDFLKKVI
jgi:hypothetical protein